MSGSEDDGVHPLGSISAGVHPLDSISAVVKVGRHDVVVFGCDNSLDAASGGGGK